MKTRIWRIFYDHEKEEKWLNEMAAKGWAMSNYNFLYYTFEECTPGEYTYRIELLKSSPAKSENVRYIRFMEDNGVEHIESYLDWVYFRKKAASGAFEIYSDFDAKIEHYQRISKRFLIVGILELIFAATQIVFYLVDMKNGEPGSIPTFVMILLVIVGMSFLRLYWSYAGRIKRLKTGREIFES